MPAVKFPKPKTTYSLHGKLKLKSMFYIAVMIAIAKSHKSSASYKRNRLFQSQTYSCQVQLRLLLSQSEGCLSATQQKEREGLTLETLKKNTGSLKKTNSTHLVFDKRTEFNPFPLNLPEGTNDKTSSFVRHEAVGNKDVTLGT